uniref:Reverse transcriptase domain-containing protein n=1 Tax=Oryzias sinensis TaxID=183150 RepID=A0A8C8E0L6_9TELE
MVNPTDVEQVINELSSTSSSGPDGIEAKFFKLASHVLCFPLAALLNLSFTTAEVPLAWKRAKVIPLHKGGKSNDMSNYRPISIINSIVKVYEKIIFNQLSEYLTLNNILSPFQSGFQKHFSTTSALLKFTNDIFSGFDNNMLTGALFIDLTKAFDMVDHYLLLDKLHSIGLDRSSLLWFNSYLHHRQQCVLFNGSYSNFLSVDKGVPQGSALGPLLFSIFINDLPTKCIYSNIQLYADDTVIYSSKSNIVDIQHSIQHDFNSVQLWLESNKLLLNKSKSYFMLFQKRLRPVAASEIHLTYLDMSLISVAEKFKYLGLWLDSSLSFSAHIQSIVHKISYRLKLLYLSINCFSLSVRKKIISQLIIPTLDYGDIIYQNTTLTNLRPLNVIYNSLCRFILRCPFRTHHCLMFQQLSWLPLSSRRQFHWLLFIFKCINLSYPDYLKQYLTPFQSSYNLRHADQIFFAVPRVKKQIGKYSFNYKAPSDWNNLPLSIRSLTSFFAFKNACLVHLQHSCNCF